ncbi:MAG: site-specific DNA-methyltransferase [Christensenellaceae bacterium]|jgi:adenine-specific DNA-methyltransferase|nr:site-specific DNA-methyltransferase [Christensenellaceae bacterium]
MSKNLSKEKRVILLDKISKLKAFLESANATPEMRAYLTELESELKKQKYGLVFEEHEEEIDVLLKTHTPVLTEQKDLFVNNGGQMNFLIEGDNLAALTLLEKTHKGKIDVIYIDPPYNTGAKDWKYDNDYVDGNDLFRHSKWASFMHKRLVFADKLLAENGILVCTIDNYEIHNLQLLMEHTLSNRDFVITVIEHNHRGRAKNNFALTHEYAVWAIPKDKDLITRKAEFAKDAVLNLRRTGTNSLKEDRPTMFYGIIVNKKTLEIVGTTQPLADYDLSLLNNNTEYEIILPIDSTGVERRWYYGAEKTISEARIGNVFAKRSKDKLNVYFKFDGKPIQRKSVWTGAKYDASSHGTVLLNEIVGKDAFSFPKSLFAVKECIEAGTADKSATILDFFAGSGTTGHAVLELNREDGGDRKFILCTNNENGICRDVTYERVKTVITGKRKDGSKYSDGMAGSLKYQKIDFVPISEQTYYDYADELLKHIKELVELENAINFDGNLELDIFLSEDEVERFFAATAKLRTVKTIYLAHDISLNLAEQKLLQDNGITVNVIPEYYYNERQV